MTPTRKQENRCHKMLEEAGAFSKRLASCETKIKALKKATDGIVATADKVLSGPMPGVWDKSTVGTPIALPGSSAGLMPAGQLRRSNSLELKTAVLDPIAAWQAEYMHAKARVADLDATSLELDAKRRAYYARKRKHIKDNIEKSDMGHTPLPQEDEDPELINARVRFETIEMEVHNELVQLANRARGVQAYISKCMRLEADALLAASAITTPNEQAIAVYSQPAISASYAPATIPSETAAPYANGSAPVAAKLATDE